VFTRKDGGCYYVQFYANGKQIVRALHDLKGNPITVEREARKAADVLVRPYNLADTADLRQSAYNALRNADDAVADAQAVADTVRLAEEGRQAAARDARDAEEAHRSRLGLAETWRRYVDSMNRPQSGETTLAQYAFQWHAFARWMAANRPEAVALADVTGADGEAYATSLAAALAPGTVNKHTRLLALVFRVLGAKEPLPHGNPFAGLTPRREAQNHRQELRLDRLRAVFDAAVGEVKTLLFIGLYSGQRLADCVLLTWDQVDLETGWLHVTPRKTRRTGTSVSVPLFRDLANVLAIAPPESRRGYVLPALAADYLANRDRVTDRIQALLKRCGIDVHEPGTGPGTGKRAVLRYGFHSLRHSTATILQEAGAPAAVAEAILGHRSEAMRQRYTHVGREALTAAMHRMPSLVEEEAPKALPVALAPACADLVTQIGLRLPHATEAKLQAVLAILAE
jgi:integrase